MAAKKKSAAGAWTSRVAEKIEAAKTLSGSKAKVLRPRLDEDAVAKFEKKLGARLPEDYREYLLELGGGGYGPYGGMLPLKRIDETEGRTAIVISELDDGEPVVLVAEGPGAGAVVVWDENAEVYVSLGAFAAYYERWVDEELLLVAIHGALAKALEKQKPLPPQLHAIVLQYRDLIERPPGRDASPIAKAKLALYLGDRQTALRVCEELVAIEQDEEHVELGGGAYDLVEALHPKALKDARSKDAALLAPLAVHESAAIRQWVALNPLLDTESLAKMAADPSDAVRRLVALHENASAPTLARVFEVTVQRWKELGGSSQRLFALEASLRHAKASPAHAEHVCATHAAGKDPFDPWLVRAALASPKLAAPTLARLAKHAHPAVRYGAACHPALTPELFEALAADEDEAVRAAVAFHPAAPPELLEKLTRDPSHRVLVVVTWNTRTPIASIVRLVGEGRSDLVASFFERADLPGDVKKLLEQHPEHREESSDWKTPPYIGPDGRQAIDSRSFRINPAGGPRRHRVDASSLEVWDDGAYAHPAFPVPVLPAYVEEHYGNGGRELASHPWLDDALLARLATPVEPRELHGSTLAAVAAHPRLSLAQLEALAADPSGAVGVAASPNAPAPLLARLAESDDYAVRKAVAANLRTPVAMLTKLSVDPELTVRYSVVGNASAPAALAERLVADPADSVRALASWRKRAADLLVSS